MVVVVLGGGHGGRCQWCCRGKVMVVVVVGGQMQCIEGPRSREKIVYLPCSVLNVEFYRIRYSPES